jgi:uncharacterized protein
VEHGRLRARHRPVEPEWQPLRPERRLDRGRTRLPDHSTAPFSRDTILGGPIDATVHASSTRPETELVAPLEDVAPGGAVTPITTGALLGSLRAEDTSRSWLTTPGRPLLPYHLYTVHSKQAPPAGTVTRFDIETRPTFAQIAAGHRLRLTLTTSDFPTLIPTAPDAVNLTGGIYQIQPDHAAASYVELSRVPASQLTSGVTATKRRTSARSRRHRRRAARPRTRRSPAFTG